jgi:hypothetical protein
LADPVKPTDGGPGFGETTSFYDAYSVALPSGTKRVDERCTVDFWNLTDRDMVLRIEDGPAQIVPRAKNTSIAVGRQFIWQIEGRQPQTTRLERGESALQIVIRR